MENKIIYDEIMDAIYANIPLEPYEKQIIEKYKQLYYFYYEYEMGWNKYKNFNEGIRKIVQTKSQMDKLIATETIQKLLQAKRDKESQKWNNLFEYLDTKTV